jgi:Protein of unknown function (DUF3105)
MEEMKTHAQNRHERKAKQISSQEKGVKQTSGSVKQRYRVNTSSPWRRWGWILALLVVAAIVVAVVLLVQSQSGDITGIVTYSNLSRNHTEKSVTYAQIPPVGGDHSASWQTCGIYSSPVPNEHAVHSLEHGAVWITYQPTLDGQSIEQLRSLVRGHDHALLSPYPGLPSPVVISAWGLQLRVTSASDARLARFISKHENGPQTPEPGAACSGSGGVGTPDIQ